MNIQPSQTQPLTFIAQREVKLLTHCKLNRRPVVGYVKRPFTLSGLEACFWWHCPAGNDWPLKMVDISACTSD